MITIKNGYLRYNDSEVSTFSQLNMTMLAGQWTCILGRSGCGKSSLLRYLAGLLKQRVQWSGEITVSSPLSPLQNNIAYMAQQDLLMPWLSVIDNVLLSNKFSNQGVKPKKSAALALLDQVGLSASANSLPQQLSGGMRQRVALARTLMQNKPVVLMDEPFAALDAVTRYRLQELAWDLLKDKTVILITHDPQEAIRLAGQIYIMQGAPSSAQLFTLPAGIMPRPLDAQSAIFHQQIIQRLAAEYA